MLNTQWKLIFASSLTVSMMCRVSVLKNSTRALLHIGDYPPNLLYDNVRMVIQKENEIGRDSLLATSKTEKILQTHEYLRSNYKFRKAAMAVSLTNFIGSNSKDIDIFSLQQRKLEISFIVSSVIKGLLSKYYNLL